MSLSDDEIERYARQMILAEIADEGQEALAAARLLIIGAGGLGVPALINATGAGFGHITIMDDDGIEATNLNRQFIYNASHIGAKKAEIAAERARHYNPHIEIKAKVASFGEATAALVSEFDIIIDASDNLETRHWANQACLQFRKPLIFVSAIRFEGQLSVFAPHLEGQEDSPCLSCLFPAAPSQEQAPNCATVGILGAVTSLLGSWASLEAVKLATGAGTPLIGKLILFDGLTGHTDSISVSKQPDCPHCR